jgi:hypothetical protein
MKARSVASGSDVIRLDKPKKKGCGGTCSGCKSGKGCDGKMGRMSRHKETPNDPEPDMDRDDALSPQEYLAACDLGIQGRSRSYIRARLDAAASLERKDAAPSGRGGKKCGGSWIPANKKCGSEGGGTPTKKAGVAEKALRVGGRVGMVAGVVQAARGVQKGNATQALRGAGNLFAGGAAAAAGNAMRNKRKGQKVRMVGNATGSVANAGIAAALHAAANRNPRKALMPSQKRLMPSQKRLMPGRKRLPG